MVKQQRYESSLASIRTKTADIPIHRPSLQEVLKKASAPVKYHPCIDDDDDSEDKSAVQDLEK